MIKRMLQTAGFAGMGAALVLTLIQAIWVSPLILQAETYEQAASAGHSDPHEAGEHHHEDAGWAAMLVSPCSYTKWRSVAHLVSWWRLLSWSLRRTLLTWVSTVLIEMNSSFATSRYE